MIVGGGGGGGSTIHLTVSRCVSDTDSRSSLAGHHLLGISV